MRKLAFLPLACLLALPLLRADEAPHSQNPKASPESRAEDLLKRMTLDEKLAYIGGEREMFIRAVPRLGIPEIKMSDGPLGCRCYGKAPAYPAGICGAASWNPEIARATGVALARDSRARGVHIILAPGVNIYRDPRCGRNFEYAGEDPFLAGRTVVAEIQGIQSQGVLATIKHFACNNQESKRGSYNAIVDERTLREIYLPAFKMAIVEGKAACIMDAYNCVNGEHCTQNAFLNIQVLRKEWGFTGITMSDWVATHDTAAAANGGLDLEMPSGKLMSPEKLKKAIAEGSVTEETIDVKVRNILRTVIAAGFFDRPQELKEISKDDPASDEAALNEAREGIVLLKNEGSVLPLDAAKAKTIVVMGPAAHPGIWGGGGSSHTSAIRPVSVFEGIKSAAPGCETVFLDFGLSIDAAEAAAVYEGPVKMELFKNKDLKGKPELVKEVEKIGLNPGKDAPEEGFPKVGYSVRWTAKIAAKETGFYSFATFNDDGARVYLDGKPVIADWSNHIATLNSNDVKLEAGSVHDLKVEYFQGEGDAILRFGWGFDNEISKKFEIAKNADAVIYCAGFKPSEEGEGSDRQWALPEGQVYAIQTISKANPKTIVALFAGGGVDFNGWLDGVPALLHAWFPGQAGGRAIAEIVFGSVNPSGKLPISIERKLEDNPSFKFFLNKEDMAKGKAVYGEGVFVGYRGYDANDVAPLFPFGFGLSYASFAYDGLKISAGENGGVKATFNIKNASAREGSEVAQIYVAPPKGAVPRPPKELKGFIKVQLKPGESKSVAVELDKDAFACWSPESKEWIAEPGAYGILVGASSRDIRLTGSCQR